LGSTLLGITSLFSFVIWESGQKGILLRGSITIKATRKRTVFGQLKQPRTKTGERPMDSLTALQTETKNEFVSQLKKEADRISNDLILINNLIAALNDKITGYNSILSEVHVFRNDVAKEIADNSGEEDEVKAAWADEWDQGYAEEIDDIPEVEVEKLTHADELDNLPQEP